MESVRLLARWKSTLKRNWSNWPDFQHSLMQVPSLRSGCEIAQFFCSPYWNCTPPFVFWQTCLFTNYPIVSTIIRGPRLSIAGCFLASPNQRRINPLPLWCRMVFDVAWIKHHANPEDNNRQVTSKRCLSFRNKTRTITNVKYAWVAWMPHKNKVPTLP